MRKKSAENKFIFKTGLLCKSKVNYSIHYQTPSHLGKVTFRRNNLLHLDSILNLKTLLLAALSYFNFGTEELQVFWYDL